jgi:redox-regulated HSP33 family molecular chaperone
MGEVVHEMAALSDERKKHILKLMKFINKLRDKIPANGVNHSVKCPFCGGKFIFSKSRVNGHMRAYCHGCRINMVE